MKNPTWTLVKAKLATFDRAGLLGLVRDLYAADKENRTFLHARFGLGEDVLEPYKQTIERWLWPDVIRNQNTSATKAKQAIASYKKAVGEPAGLAELMVFYCEQAAGFCHDLGNDDEVYFAALVRMFDKRSALPERCQSATGKHYSTDWITYEVSARTLVTASATIWIPSLRSTRNAMADRPYHLFSLA